MQGTIEALSFILPVVSIVLVWWYFLRTLKSSDRVSANLACPVCSVSLERVSVAVEARRYWGRPWSCLKCNSVLGYAPRFVAQYRGFTLVLVLATAATALLNYSQINKEHAMSPAFSMLVPLLICVGFARRFQISRKVVKIG